MFNEFLFSATCKHKSFASSWENINKNKFVQMKTENKMIKILKKKELFY